MKRGNKVEIPYRHITQIIWSVGEYAESNRLNMWKTVSARLRGADQELIDMGETTEGMVESTSKLRDLVKGTTGFDIMVDEAGTQFKDIYDIVVGIGEKFQEIPDIERAGLLEALAGKNQSNALAAALTNIDIIKQAYQTAEYESVGSAERELANYQKGNETVKNNL